MTMMALGQATATGGDGTYTFANDAPANGFPLGPTAVNWTVTDGAGAQAAAAQMITISDTTPPTVATPPDIQTTATGANTTVSLGAPTVTDLADTNPTVSNDMPANGFPLGTTPVTWTATDASGNSATAQQMITITTPSGGPLTLTAPGAITLEAAAPATMATLGAAMVTGGTPPMTITNDAPAGGFPVGATTVTWTVLDAAMTSATGTQTVTITDTTAPTITAPADVTADQGPGYGAS